MVTSRGCQIPWLWGCELPDMDAGNQTSILQCLVSKSNCGRGCNFLRGHITARITGYIVIFCADTNHRNCLSIFSFVNSTSKFFQTQELRVARLLIYISATGWESDYLLPRLRNFWVLGRLPLGSLMSFLSFPSLTDSCTSSLSTREDSGVQTSDYTSLSGVPAPLK